MSIAAGAPTWLFALLLLLLALAAVEDGWRLRISNLIVAGVAASAVAAMAWIGIGWQAWQPALMAVAILAVGTPMFAAGWMGGGDIKLLAASVLWFTLDGGWKMLVAVAMAGGLLTIVTLTMRFVVGSKRNAKIAILRRGTSVPYGIAVATGVAVTTLWAR